MAIALKEGRAVYGEEAIAERPDGTRRWFTPFPRPLRNAEGKIIGGINMLVDITDRKQLHSSSNLLAAIVNSSDDAIVSKNLSGIITSWNKGAERIFGYTSQEVIGRSITVIIPPDHLDEEADILARIGRGERIDHFDTVRRRKDGTLVDVAVTISPVRDATGRIIGASKVARDISDRRRSERELRDSEERFRSIVETTPECVKIIAADGTLLQMNAAGLALVGADSPEAVIGKNVYNLIAPDDRDRFRSFNERVCAGHKGTLEFEIVSLQGVHRCMETQGAPFRTPAGQVAQLAVTRDVSDRKRSERDLANAARQQKALFHLADRLHRAASLHDVYTAATDAICEALQCERASILLYDHAGIMRFVSWRGLSDAYRSAVEGHSPWKIDDPDPRPVCIENVHSAALDDGLLKVVSAEGIVALAFIPLVSDNRLIGKFMMYFSNAHDFTGDELEVSLTIARQLAFGIERKQADQALRQSEERFRTLSETLDAEVRVRTRQLEQRSRELMQHSDQVRDLSRQLLQTQDNERRHFARELHDSAGQTLTVLSMALSQLQQRAAALDPELASQVEASEQLVQQLHQEIRTTSYLLHPPLLDESGLASALAWYTQGLAERTPLKINLDIPHDLERIPKQMELGVFRVVQECLTNIHRHSGATDALIRISRSNGTLSLEVADNGKGIPADKLAEIQLKGTGVGIRGMRERVGQFQGEMKIESGPSGTKILVSLPVPVSQQPSPLIDAPPLAAPTVLS
jgi:PAS domain S-box-containing protein